MYQGLRDLPKTVPSATREHTGIYMYMLHHILMGTVHSWLIPDNARLYPIVDGEDMAFPGNTMRALLYKGKKYRSPYNIQVNH